MIPRKGIEYLKTPALKLTLELLVVIIFIKLINLHFP
nr:MAG TPA: hypothetical protein [Crassvirales sp.]